MTYRYIYKITCTEGRFKNKFYYGQHTTTNLDDGYKGSGSLLRDYYKKYPNDYIKEIIAFYNTQEELNIAEHDIIEPYLGTNNCLNLKGGGDKGELTEEYKQRISNKLKGRKRSIESRIKQSESTKGTHHKDKTKQILSKKLKGKPKSEEHKQHLHKPHKVINRNPPDKQTKTKISNTIKSKCIKWMTNGIDSKPVPETEQQYYLDNGYYYGRIIEVRL